MTSLDSLQVNSPSLFESIKSTYLTSFSFEPILTFFARIRNEKITSQRTKLPAKLFLKRQLGLIPFLFDRILHTNYTGGAATNQPNGSWPDIERFSWSETRVPVDAAAQIPNRRRAFHLIIETVRSRSLRDSLPSLAVLARKFVSNQTTVGSPSTTNDDYKRATITQ